LSRFRACAFRVFGRNSSLTSGCSIVYILPVINFAHLDGSVRKVYDWCPLDKFPKLNEGAD
jgi:hypothetical protein